MQSTIDNRQTTFGNRHWALGNGRVPSLALAALLALTSTSARAAPQGLSSAFTYQGYLEFSSGPVNNATDMRFSLYDEEMAGAPIAGPIVFDGNGTNLDPVDVVNGYFTVTLDFGTSPLYSGKALWLEIEIRQHTALPCQSDSDCLASGTCNLSTHICVFPYYLLQPRTSLTGTPLALGLRYPQTGRAEIDGPMFNMIQSGEGSVLEIESADDVCLEGSSPTFMAKNLACGSVGKFVSQPPQFNPAPPPPTLVAQNFSGGVGVSVLLAPHPEATMVNPSVPALAVTNRATGVAAVFHIPDPMLPIEDGCPPQCPPFPWPWTDVVAPGIDVINQSGGPAGRFSTDSNLLLPAVHVANVGMGTAVQAVNNNAVPTVEATNNSGGSAGKFEAVAFNPQPDPPQPALIATHHGGGGAAKFESVAFNPQPDPPGFPAIEAIHGGGGSAGKFEAVAFNPQPDPPQPALVATHQGGGGAAKFESYAFNPQPDPPMLNTVPTVEVTNHGGGGAAKFAAVAFNPQPDPPGYPAIDVIHGGGGSAGRFVADTDALLPAILVTNMGDGMACQAVSQGTAAAIEATNMGTGPGMKALSNNSGGWAFEANNAAGTAIKAVGGNGICFDGEGDLRVTGEITKNYGNGSPSFHRTGPIAYATINLDGTVAAGTPNVSSAWNLPNQRYEITITGETYSTVTHVTTVTPIANGLSEALFATTGSGGGQLRIRIMSSSTGTVGQQKPFHFVVYKP